MLTDRSRIARSLCSSLAIATALIVGSGIAQAQSLQGNGVFASGTGGITTSTGTTTVSITSSNAVIDWTTFDTAIGGGPINFQSASTTATFQSVSDFSVLNRIIPTDPSRAIQFNGNIIAQIQGTTTTPGGTVYFYSPGGVIVGSTAVFNVGNLGLTSIAPAVVGGVFEQTGMSGEFVQFNGAVTPGSAVTIQTGAQINVPNNNYVAIVAPMVNNAGTINVNGAAALVSADAATITFNPTGLFDIQVTSGTSSTGNSGNGRTLINTGTITGPAFNGTGAVHRVYAVAVPKNTAITMVIGNGSSLGFNIAGAANIAGNAVILSAGHDIAGGQIVAAPSAGGGSGTVMIDSFNANYTSEVVARATGRALFASDGTVGAGNTSFAANLTAHSATIASLEARSGGSANVTGNLTLDANAFAATPTSSVTAGNAYLDARNGASLTVGGNAVVVATAQGGNATGGNADATADTGGIINIAGVLRVRSEGLGGSGGSGTGGMASVNARAGGDIFADQLNLTAEGVGGGDVGAGAGNGRGGNISLIAMGAGSTINIANGNSTGTGRELFFSAARGFGGQSNGGGSGIGGSAIGGNVTISVTNGAAFNGPATVGSAGFTRIFARAFGGDANTGASAGGAATGGNINITVDNATFTSAELLPSSFAQAGSALPTATGTINGGNATGGTRNITVRNGATATTAFSGGGPGAQGGDGTLSGRGGDASGGSASLVVDNATLTLTGRGIVFSQNQAGAGGTTGNVTAGTAFGQVSNGAVVNVFNDTVSTNDDFSISSNAFGALSPATPGTAQGTVTAGTATLLVQGGTIQGAGTVGVGADAFAQSDQYAQGGTYRGGTANLQVQGGTISVAQIRVTANANAAAVGAGLSGTGGSATGGTARLQLNGGTLSGSGLEVNAEAFGGAIGTSGSGNGGMATGGLASIPVGAGSNTLTFNTINLTADAEGGDVSGTVGNGGAGVGGVAQINVFGGASLTVNASTTVIESDGLGGDALSLTGNGGGGNAGRALLVVDGGSATLNGNLTLSGDSGGGNGINGGTAFGDGENNQSRAFLFARNGSLAITGLTALHAVAGGGTGNLGGNGGNATGGFANVAANNLVSGGGVGILTLGDLDIDSGAQGGSATGTGNGGHGAAGRAHLFANGGTITVGGTATLSGDAIGGDGVNGGNAISARPDLQPRALIGAFNGTIDVAGATSLVASASGGSGRLGGTGGVAFAGQAAVDAQSPNGSSAISLGTLNIEASALGGLGGAGASGQVGGAGGDAYGGPISALGNAGRGVLTVRGSTLLRTGATGGTGGQGGTGGTSAPGAVGGAGGRAFGGSLTVGTRSGVDTPSNAGSATFGQVSGDANALGGAGGAGGLGTTQGAGGAGGSGFGGDAGILVRGSPATFGDVTLTANGTGGNGGAGATQGDGGDGYAGDGFVNVTQRFMRTERGSLTANNVNITSAGVGGGGATAGDTFYSAATGAESDFFIRQSNVTLANLVLTTSGALAPNFITTVLSVVDPVVSGIPVPTSVTVTAEPFDLAMADSTASIAGNFTLSTPGNMRVSLGNSTLNVGNLTLSAGNFVLPAVRPATLGTINVSSGLTISTLLDFLAYANFNVGFNGAFSAGGSVLTGDLTLAGAVDIVAGGSITTGTISASDVALDAGQAILTAAITTGGSIDLTAGGAITTGQLTAGNTVEANAGGALNVAGASAGIVNPSTATGAEYNIGLRSLISITAGNLSARANVGLSSPGTIAVGNVSAGGGILALAGTGLTTGSLSTAITPGSRIYLANFSMEALGGEIGNTFDPAPILAANAVAINGPIAINGTVNGVTLQANTSQSLSISGNASLLGAAVLVATGAITTANIDTGDRLIVGAGGAVTLGNVTSGTVQSPSQTTKIAIAGSSVTIGSASALRDLGIQSSGAITTGALRGRDVLLLGGAGITTGSILAGSQTLANGRVYIGNFSQATPTANVFTPFLPSPTQPGSLQTLFAQDPVRAGGALTIGGGVSAGSLKAAAAQGISLQAVTTPAISTQTGSGGFIEIESGGTVTVNGRLAAGNHIDIVSRDIDITQTGSIDGLSINGEILLASENPNGMFVGDGLTTTNGYALSNAEYGRLRAGEIDIVGIDVSNLATDLTIGTLTINASQLYGADGIALFASGNRETETPSGILRIAGAVTGNGFSPTTTIELLSGTVEIEAVNGSLKVNAGQSDTGSTTSPSLGGLIFIEADNVHIASDAILTKLRADPLYTGHIDELNAPAAVQRPDGVFNALGFEVNVGKTFFIQNTGSRIAPAGFLTTFDNTEVNAPDGQSTSRGELVLNGQFVTSTGTVSGKSAFDLVIADMRSEPNNTFDFSDTSTLNGCAFVSGACAFGQSDPVAAISSEISVIISPVLAASPPPPAVEEAGPGDSSASSSETEAAAEEADSSDDEKKDEGDGDEAASPIAPPAPLISTRALDGDVNVVEPVSGAGNPALFGSAVNETTIGGGKP